MHYNVITLKDITTLWWIFVHKNAFTIFTTYRCFSKTT